MSTVTLQDLRDRLKLQEALLKKQSAKLNRLMAAASIVDINITRKQSIILELKQKIAGLER